MTESLGSVCVNSYSNKHSINRFIIGVVGFIVIQHPSGTLDLHILVMTEDAVIVMKLLTLGGDFGRVGYIPAGFTVLDVFLNLDVPCHIPP